MNRYVGYFVKRSTKLILIIHKPIAGDESNAGKKFRANIRKKQGFKNTGESG